MEKKNIAVVGTGYVGLSLSVLLSRTDSVLALDIVHDRVEKINNRISPIKDKEIEEYLRDKDLDLKAVTDSQSAYGQADFIIVAVPTNYDSKKNFF